MKTKNKETAERLERARSRHWAALETLAQQVGCKTQGLTLWRKLRRLENKVYACCERYSNEGSYGIARWESDKESAKHELKEIFGGKIPTGVYINSDPRGSMLKLDAGDATKPGVKIPDGMVTDWGGDGILAAEITKENV